MNRRDFIRSTAVVAGSLAFAGISNANVQKKPNVLIIMTDQQFAGAMSCAGNPYLNTPAMDKITKRGIRFEKAYTSNPLCVPSRCHMFTGVQGEEKRRNLSSYECIGLTLKNAGYDTGYTGKWHISVPLKNKEWSGFDFQEFTHGGKTDRKIAEPCGEFITQKRDKPFFLVASFHNPHDICSFARVVSGNYVEREYNPETEEYYNGFIGKVPDAKDCPPLPKNFHLPDAESEVIRLHQRESPNASSVFPTVNWKDNGKWRQYLWAYYRMCELVDKEIAKILNALEQGNKLNDTVIIFTADHGDGMGSHQWNQKQLFYDETARIPFMISQPGTLPQNKVDKTTLVNTGIDIATTVLNIAGIKPDSKYFGQPLYDICKGTSDRTHDFIVSETRLQAKDKLILGRMVRTAQYKYVVFDHGQNPEMLFDMENDPGEMKNLAVRQEYSKELMQHRSLLGKWLKQNGDNFKIPAY